MDDDLRSELDKAYINAVVDGYDKFVEAFHQEAEFQAVMFLASFKQAGLEFDPVEVLAASYLEGMYQYHQFLKELCPQAAEYMDAWLADIAEHNMNDQNEEEPD